MESDRRQFQRAHVLRRGRIVFRRGHSSIDCVVLDLSAGGARLRVGEWLGLPERFELRIESGPAREAEVRFRDMGMTGIEFVDRAAA
jgi:PilZ domain